MLNANDDSVYADFHFSQVQENNEATSGSGKSMSDQAKALLNDKDSSDPLKGLTVVNPDEFLLGQILQFPIQWISAHFGSQKQTQTATNILLAMLQQHRLKTSAKSRL